MLNRIVLCFSLVSAPAFSYLDKDDFESCVSNYYSTPKEVLDLQHKSSVEEVEHGRRIHHFSIMATQPDSADLLNIGRVKLVDFKEYDSVLEHFALDLIEIAEEYQGKGFGSKALKEVVSFSQVLAAKDQEYTYLQLQCADETASGEQLGKVPYRLSYYLNAGFQLDAKTLDYMQHLDRNYFIQRLGLKQFKDFIEYYLPPETAAVARKYSSTILRELKKIAKGSGPITEDQVLQIAESSSSDAAQRILDRLFYDSIIRDTEQMCSGGYMYLMRMNVFEWEKAKTERQELLSSREETKALNTSEDDYLKDLIEVLADKCTSAQKSRKKRCIGKENLPLEENEAIKRDLKRAKN